MFAIRSRTGTGVCDGYGVKIDYSEDVLEEIRRLAVDGFSAFAHGGLETGGVLYGLRGERRIKLVSFAELSCEHARGPGFVLSENDHFALTGLMQPPPGLETVGWFRSHTRGGLDIDSVDREIFDRYFQHAKSTALLLRPTHWGTAEAAFFIGETSGEILPAANGVFTLEPLKSAEPTKPITPEGQEDTVPAREIPVSPKSTLRVGHIWRTRNWAICAAALAMAAGLIYWSRPSRKLELHASATAPGEVRIQWNRRSKPVLEGESGIIHIEDGGSFTKIPLDHDRLRTSSVTYRQRTGHLTIRLIVNPRNRGSSASADAIEYLGQPAPSSAQVEIRRDPPALSIPPIETRRDPPETSANARGDADRLRQDTIPPGQLQQEGAKAKTSSPDNRRPVRRAILPPLRSSSAKPDAAVLPAPPAVDSRPAASNALPDFLSRSAIRPAPLSPPPAKGAHYSGPRSGRLIWTGVVAKRGVIEIDGTHVSVGSVNARLPDVPVSVRVLPCEFSHEGLIVYTADQARAGVREPPAKSNGWNSIHFKFDPVRARELVVLEAPNGSNDFSRLVIRNEGRPWSVIAIDWSVR